MVAIRVRVCVMCVCEQETGEHARERKENWYVNYIMARPIWNIIIARIGICQHTNTMHATSKRKQRNSRHIFKTTDSAIIIIIAIMFMIT